MQFSSKFSFAIILLLAERLEGCWRTSWFTVRQTWFETYSLSFFTTLIAKLSSLMPARCKIRTLKTKLQTRSPHGSHEQCGHKLTGRTQPVDCTSVFWQRNFISNTSSAVQKYPADVCVASCLCSRRFTGIQNT